VWLKIFIKLGVSNEEGKAEHSKEFKVSTTRMMESKGVSAKDVEGLNGIATYTIRQWHSSN
jgi:hypothetical protein